MKNSRKIAALLSVAMLASCGGGLDKKPSEPVMMGGWKTASPKDAGVQNAVNAAVQAQAKLSDEALTLVAIEAVQTQVVAGMNYKVTLKVNRGDKNALALATVWAKLDKTYALINWSWQ